MSQSAPMRRIVIATGNPGKVREFRAILDGHGWELLTPAEAGVLIPAVVETGRSYAENAISKATAIANASGLPALADDSGIEVDALDGRPGPLSARFGGPRCQNDAERTALLLELLRDVPPGRRGARFRSVIAFVRPGNRPVLREGAWEGRIALEPRGSDGFGYDPVFELADGRTAAEIGDEKQRVSHRARALHAMAEALARLA